jgi:predicted transposase YbfD/YdcC
MKYIPLSFDVNLGPEAVVIDLDSLFAALASLEDLRDARGLRYALVTILVFIVLAKLCGEDHLRGIAQWVAHRKEALAEALGLAKAQAPHATTYSRVLNKAIDIGAFEQAISDFFRNQPGAGQSVLINFDGKTMRATIPEGKTRGVHLLAAYFPQEGWVAFQVEVGDHENEIPATVRAAKQLDLRGKVVTGDALLAQRELSTVVVERGGAYVWTVKDNQGQLKRDIETLFEPESCTGGFSPCHTDFQTKVTYGKGHGRRERRTLTSSSMLNEYVDWPFCQQVFCLERHFVRISDDKVTDEVSYGVTSLARQEADAERLLALGRGHWGIENGLHFRRDDTLKEDRCRLKGQGAQAMAAINNLVLGLVRNKGFETLPDARRYYAAHLQDAVALVLCSPG